MCSMHCALEEVLSDVLFTLCQQQAPHIPVCDRVTQTVQSTWPGCLKGWHHGRIQKPSHHTGVTTSPLSSVADARD